MHTYIGSFLQSVLINYVAGFWQTLSVEKAEQTLQLLITLLYYQLEMFEGKPNALPTYTPTQKKFQKRGKTFVNKIEHNNSCCIKLIKNIEDSPNLTGSSHHLQKKNRQKHTSILEKEKQKLP